MLKSVTLKFFRKHEELAVLLTEGLQTLRGTNEAGKTTILEGAAYALFGSKALRDSMAETVTWGHKESELYAEAVLSLDKDYTFKRSKSGAEVLVAGNVFVSGQNEVSAFAASLLGADVNVAHHLMLAGQGGLRGVLEQGPKATSNLIETLSDLDLIDRIIEAAQEKLTLGSTAVLEDRLKVAEQTLATTVAPVAPVAPDLTAQRDTIEKADALLPAAVEERCTLTAYFDAECNKRSQAAMLTRDIEQQKEHAAQTTEKLAQAKTAATVQRPDIEPIRAALREAEDYENRARAWRTFGELMPVGFRLPADAFQRMSVRVTSTLADLKQRQAELNGEIRAMTPQVATSHKCPACGQDTAHLADVIAKQDQLKARLAEAQAALAKIEAALPEAVEDNQELSALINANQRNLELASTISAYVAVDSSVTPVEVSWIGEKPSESVVDIPAVRRRLEEAEATASEIGRAAVRVETLSGVIEESQVKIAKLNADIAALSLMDDEEYLGLCTRQQCAAATVLALEGDKALATIQIEEAEKAYAAEMAGYTKALVDIETMKKAAESLQADIEATQFNNQLVKKVRAARPIIANKLWNLVLATVSTLFSQMRGEQSVVAKGKDGFTVNGRSVSSLSGSTLDILGLAIRCALVKTFVPDCPFLVLDEPSAACDDNRSAALIGFVASAGFKQVILVTHEDISEALSSNLIQL